MRGWLAVKAEPRAFWLLGIPVETLVTLGTVCVILGEQVCPY